jgi:hypothetical protein
MATLAGFQNFINTMMGVPSGALPPDSPAITWAYNIAVELVVCYAQVMFPDIYDLMVYNLAADNLLNFAPDNPPSTWFSQQRTLYGLENFVPGLVQSTGDNGTSTSLMIPDALKNLTLADLQYLKTPYGRRYLQFAQRFSTVWGIS